VINAEISAKTIENIFKRIDILLDTRKVDLIIGGPPCQAYSLV
jgi:DNA (cytosine-5)-methyltransferase 1